MQPSVLVIANLYPTIAKPFFGTFVKNSADELQKQGAHVEIVALPQYGSGFMGYCKFYLAAFIAAFKHDGIAYVHYVSHSVFPILLAKIFNRKLTVILHYHGSDAFAESYEGKLRRLFKTSICILANRISFLVVVPSKFFANKIIEKFKLDPNEVFISPSGGVDSGVFYSRRNYPLPINPAKTFLYSGRMLKGKGCLVAAEAAIRLANINNDIKFKFIGDGPQRHNVLTILKPLIDSNRCEISGALSQDALADEFRKANFFMFPSYREGESLGLVVIEAMACGAIPLAINQAAISEILGDNTSLLFNSKEEFVAQIDNILSLSDTALENIRVNLLQRAKTYERSLVCNQLLTQFKRLNDAKSES
jgi:glycosyltransferase involved in cell wall biosynthesis